MSPLPVVVHDVSSAIHMSASDSFESVWRVVPNYPVRHGGVCGRDGSLLHKSVCLS